MHRGITLVELLAVLVIAGVVAAFALPRLNGSLDGIAVRSAAAEVANAFALARQAAIARVAYATVRVDSVRGAVTVSLRADTVLHRPLRDIHKVSIRSNRDSMAYDPLGHGFGAANQSIVISRGSVTDTVVISRLGRVR